MITYRVAFLGNEPEVYTKASEFFAEKNNDENEKFKIELVDISKANETSIRATHFHGIVYDVAGTMEGQAESKLATLIRSRANVEELKILPLTKSEVVRDDANRESARLEQISGRKSVKALPINVTNENNLKSVFQSIDISSI